MRKNGNWKIKYFVMNNRHVLFTILVVILTANFALVESWGQIPTIPPPPPFNSSFDSTKDLKIEKGDKTPPKIEVLTKELSQGKNVVEIKMTDESDIKTKHIVFVKKGTLSLTSMVEDSENHYVALIEALPPSTVIRVDATDAANNHATIYKQLIVTEPKDFFYNFFSSLSKIFSSRN